MHVRQHRVDRHGSAQRQRQPVKSSGLFRLVTSGLTMAEAKTAGLEALGVQYEGKTGFSHPDLSWAS